MSDGVSGNKFHTGNGADGKHYSPSSQPILPFGASSHGLTLLDTRCICPFHAQTPPETCKQDASGMFPVEHSA